MSSIWTIRRSTTDVKVAGLCGGLAREWGVDPVLVRVGWALLALSGGLGLVLYLAGWLLLPAEGRESSPVEDMLGDPVRRWPRELWVAIVVIACVATFALLGWLTPFGIGPALVIALIWYFGFYRPRMKAQQPPMPAALAAVPGPPPAAAPFRYPGPATPFTQAAEAWQQRVAEYQAASAGAPPVPPWTAAPAAPPWTAPPAANLSPAYAPPPPAYAAPPVPAGPFPVVEPDPEQAERAAFLATPDPAGLYVEPTGSTAAPALVPPGRRLSARRLRWAGLLALGLTMAGLAAADQLGAPVTPTLYATAALLVAGLTLALATWFGRARGILPVAALLAVGVLGLSSTGPGAVAAPDPGPTRTLSYTSAAALPERADALDVGTLKVDLSRLALTSDATYRARVDLGRLVVAAPPDTNVVVRYSVDLGSATAFDQLAAGGPELTGTTADPAPMRADRPTLTLDLTVGLGAVQVTR